MKFASAIFLATAIVAMPVIAKASPHKVLGHGHYQAVAYRGVITLTARGYTPNPKVTAELDKLPTTVFPPEYALYFIDHNKPGQMVPPVMTPFTLFQHLENGLRIKTLMVTDADGRHPVKVVRRKH